MSAVPTARKCRFTAIDFESAGAARGRTDSPVQIGLATWDFYSGHGKSFVSYLATDQPILWSARKVHGIGPEDLAAAPCLLTLWPTLRNFMKSSVIVAHGKGTEQRFLRAFPGHGFAPWLDTLHLSRALWPEISDHSLGNLCELHGLAATVLQIVPGKSWHDALFDAAASLVLLEHMLRSHDLADFPMDFILRPDTSAWHERTRRNLRTP